jgi:antitoxin PrlF
MGAVTRAAVDPDGQMSLPAEARAVLHVDAGGDAEVEVITVGGFVLILPADRHPDQAWFWTPEWLAGELEAEADKAASRSEVFGSDEDFLAALTERGEPAV